MSDDEKLTMFTERYQSGNTPWDTGITPPEIVAIVAELPGGRALDLGCGTGTNVRYLLEQGWQADGVDFVPQAIDLARSKLADFAPERYRLFAHDVTRLDTLDGLRNPYDLVIDIGCGHGVPQPAQYAADVAALLAPEGVYMLYAHFPHEERPGGLTPDDVRRVFTPHFEIVSQTISTDTASGLPSGWYQLSRRA